MRLMGVAEGVEAGRPDLLRPGLYLRVGKRMAVADAMFVFGDAVEEDGPAVDGEGMRTGGSGVRPVDAADAVSRCCLIDDAAAVPDRGDEGIEIRRRWGPEMGCSYVGEFLADGGGPRDVDGDGLSGGSGAGEVDGFGGSGRPIDVDGLGYGGDGGTGFVEELLGDLCGEGCGSIVL